MKSFLKVLANLFCVLWMICASLASSTIGSIGAAFIIGKTARQQGISQGQADARYVFRNPLRASYGGLRICTEGIPLTIGGGFAGIDVQNFTRWIYTTSGAVTKMRLRMPGWVLNGGDVGESFAWSQSLLDVPSISKRVNVTLEYPLGTVVGKFTWTTGGAYGFVDPTGELWSTTLNIAIPAHTQFALRYHTDSGSLYNGKLVAYTSATPSVTLPANIPNDPALIGAWVQLTGGPGFPLSQYPRTPLAKIVSTTLSGGNVVATLSSTFPSFGGTPSSSSTFTILSGSSTFGYMTQAKRSGDHVSTGVDVYSGTDYTATYNSEGGDTTTVTGTYTLPPPWVYGDSSVPAVAVFGDSIPLGLGNSGNNSNGTASYGLSYTQYALMPGGVPNVGYLNLCESGKGYFHYPLNYFTKRIDMAAGCDYVLVDLATNDPLNSQSLATTEANAQALWTALAQSGAKVVASTIPPIVSCSDYGQTLTGQTVSTNETWRLGWNAWIRSKPVGLYAYIDPAKYVECNSAGVLYSTALASSPGLSESGYNLWYVGPNFPINGLTTPLNPSATGTTATLIDTVNLPTDSGAHFVNQVLAVVHSGTTYYSAISNYNPSTQTITVNPVFSFSPSASDTYYIPGSTTSSSSSTQGTGASVIGIHPNDYGSQLMAQALSNWAGIFQAVP